MKERIGMGFELFGGLFRVLWIWNRGESCGVVGLIWISARLLVFGNMF